MLAFENGGAEPPLTHLVLIEAKSYLPWTNKQLASKTERLLRKIFGKDGRQAGWASCIRISC